MNHELIISGHWPIEQFGHGNYSASQKVAWCPDSLSARKLNVSGMIWSKWHRQRKLRNVCSQRRRTWTQCSMSCTAGKSTDKYRSKVVDFMLPSMISLMPFLNYVSDARLVTARNLTPVSTMVVLASTLPVFVQRTEGFHWIFMEEWGPWGSTPSFTTKQTRDKNWVILIMTIVKFSRSLLTCLILGQKMTPSLTQQTGTSSITENKTAGTCLD